MANYFKMCYENKSDFYEMSSGNLFHIADYLKTKEMGLPDINGGILVTDAFGEEIGVVPEDRIQSILDQPD